MKNSDLLDILNRLQDLESKVSAVRIVRTQEGARKYGQPVGSIIVANASKFASRFTNLMFSAESEDGWMKIRGGGNRQVYWVGKENGKFVAISDDDEGTTLFSSKSELEVYEWLDKQARYPKAEPVRGSREVPDGYHAATIEERQKLKIAPAWVDVFINDDPNGTHVAIGYDGTDRKQMLQSQSNKNAATEAKYKRLREMSKHIKKLDTALKKDWEEYDDAAVVMLMRKLGMRIGGDRDTRAKEKAYGAMNLEARHVTINKDSITFKFVGKKGVLISLNTKDKDIYNMIVALKEGKSGRDRMFPDSSAVSVREYMSWYLPTDFLAKDLRTYKATEVALAQIAKVKTKPKTEKEYNALVKKIAESVSLQLGNTKAVALNSYIDLSLFAPLATDPVWFDNLVKKQRKLDSIEE